MKIDKHQQLKELSQLLANTDLGKFNGLAAQGKTLNNTVQAGEQPSDVAHFLRRSSYGFSSEELAFAEQQGYNNYIEYQLDQGNFDTSLIENLLYDALPSLQMSYAEIFAELELNDNFDPGFELIAATLIRAAYNQNQLYEMMVEFWSNHFNVNIFDGPIRYFKGVDDRDNVRPYALGKFRDLLHANAKSPAMLIYLDGFSNTAEGPNENYSRELMELHTLGVDGGYTEDDVKEVARCFTGWTLSNEYEDLFVFFAENHDFDSKTVLGQEIPAGGGVEDGEAVLDILASHPSTAYFVAKKLCKRFISDLPPESAVNAVADTFTQTDGDIKAMLRTLFNQQEFLDAADLKFKRPVEYVISLFRSLQPVDSNRTFEFLYRQVRKLKQTPFTFPAPTGFSDNTSIWLNTNALLDRWNLGFAIAFGDISLGRNIDDDNNPGQGLVAADFVQVPVLTMIGSARTAAEITDTLIDQVLHRPISKNDRDALINYAALNENDTVAMSLDQALARARAVLAAILASRYFQQR